MIQLQGKVIAITGAGSGIGAATAREAVARGATLSLSDIDEDATNQIVEELRAKGEKVMGKKVDVADSDSVDAWIAETVHRFGRLDGAANVAGVERSSSANAFVGTAETTNANWDFIHHVNLNGAFYCVRAEARVMERGGSILNVSSMAGVVGHAGLAAYSSSKHGVIGLSRTAAKELGEKGIRVNCLAPGFIETPMLNRLRIDRGGSKETDAPTYTALPLRREGTPEEMAKTICFVLSDDSSYTTGQVCLTDGGKNC